MIIILTTIIIGFLMTWLVVAANSSSDYPVSLIPDEWIEYRRENLRLYYENNRLKDIIEKMSSHPEMCWRNCRPCYQCERKMYAKTPSRQEIIDLMKKTSLTVEELQEKLLKEMEV